MTSPAFIIPALERNAYNPLGDLAPFGDISLLDWKIAQLKKIAPPHQIYVSTPSSEIIARAKRRGVQVIKRPPELSLKAMITTAVDQVGAEIVVWANATSPFLSPEDYLQCLQIHDGLDGEYDSVATAVALNEYLFFNSVPLNFDLHAHPSRRQIPAAQMVTNGCFVIARSLALEVGSYFGRRPFLSLIDRLSAVEIKDLADLDIATDLLALYYRKIEAKRE